MSLEPRALSDVYPSSPGLEVFQFILSILYFCPTEEVFESVEPAYSIFLFWLDPSDRFLVSLKAVAPSKFEFPCSSWVLPDDFKMPGTFLVIQLPVGPRKLFHFILHPRFFAESPKIMNSRWYFRCVGRIRPFQDNLHTQILINSFVHVCKPLQIKLPVPTARNFLSFFSISR